LCLGIGYDSPDFRSVQPRSIYLDAPTNVPLVLLDLGFNGTASLPNVIMTTFAAYAVHNCPSSAEDEWELSSVGGPHT
jgi:hypothetical protein